MPRRLMLLLAFAALAAPIVIFFALDRYHVPMLPLMAILLGGGAMQVWEAVRRRWSGVSAEVQRPTVVAEAEAEEDAAAGEG